VAEIEEPERVNRPQKITLGQMRAMGVRGLPVSTNVSPSDYHCSHWTAAPARLLRARAWTTRRVKNAFGQE
jgi:hypothetical protein